MEAVQITIIKINNDSPDTIGKNMEITNTGYDLQNIIDTIVERQLKAITETAKSQAFFEWMKKEVIDTVIAKGYGQRSPMEPEMQKWILELMEEGVKMMIEHVIEGHRLVMGDEK